ncbi:bifunctional DNA primase/polymerase [Streptomyces sp. MRC013]|uniref:bifunctional DNA primase/polymerase n=1 Tax=Streptomyces sp. MRC013 TaxID=2898276 RepID=UPI0020269CFC|nr:bifunctional DNA primase/polymerase [Streptomyces sp. MRC013]URM90968.1 bifunctional DNA primase/polymerase [Streptomyces sp. MRC013]
MPTVEETMGAGEAARVPGRRGGPPRDSAVRYAVERHWDVFPGTWPEVVGGRELCSCGDSACASPGAHPLHEDWEARATGGPASVRRLWDGHPEASVLLPTGRTFDVLDVPESAGFLALTRMERTGVPLGPVSCGPDRRMAFFVLPGAAARAAGLIRGLGWSPSGIDLVAKGRGGYVVAPPSRVAGQGAVQWVRHPTPANRWLPGVEELIGALAYACGRDAATGRR